MFIPNGDSRFFTLGTNHSLLQSTSLYSAEEYDGMYGLLLSTMPAMFSLNLKTEIGDFIAALPPAFGITVHEVIDVACYYYSDWDSPCIATDEFIDDQVVSALRHALLSGLPQALVEKELERQLQMLNDTLREFIGLIIGILSRCNCPAVIDYGCVYKLENIDNDGNVFFKIKTPDEVFDAIEENVRLVQAAIQQQKDLLSG